MKLTFTMKQALIVILVSLGLARSSELHTNSVGEVLRWMRQSITWGKSSNCLQLGVLKAESSTNTSEKYPVIVYLCNTNTEPLWGLLFPHQEYRLNLALFDSAHKSVIRTKQGDAICQPITAYEELRLTQERRKMALLPNTPHQYAPVVDLLRCFKVDRPGRYQLVVRANLFKLAKYPQVEKVTLPEVSIDLDIHKSDM